MPTSYATFHPPDIYPSKNLSTTVATPSFPPKPPPQPFKPTFTPIVQPRELPRQRLPESFNLVTPLPSAFSLRSDSTVSLYRARMENRNVVLRVLNGKKKEGFQLLTSALKDVGFCNCTVRLCLYRLC